MAADNMTKLLTALGGGSASTGLGVFLRQSRRVGYNTMTLTAEGLQLSAGPQPAHPAQGQQQQRPAQQQKPRRRRTGTPEARARQRQRRQERRRIRLLGLLLAQKYTAERAAGPAPAATALQQRPLPDPASQTQAGQQQATQHCAAAPEMDVEMPALPQKAGTSASTKEQGSKRPAAQTPPDKAATQSLAHRSPSVRKPPKKGARHQLTMLSAAALGAQGSQPPQPEWNPRAMYEFITG